jgi:hypothetical protein
MLLAYTSKSFIYLFPNYASGNYTLPRQMLSSNYWCFIQVVSAVTDIKDGTNMLYQNVSNKLSYTVHTAHKTKEFNDTVRSLKSCN